MNTLRQRSPLPGPRHHDVTPQTRTLAALGTPMPQRGACLREGEASVFSHRDVSFRLTSLLTGEGWDQSGKTPLLAPVKTPAWI